MKNPPQPPEPWITGFDLMIAAILDSVVDEIDPVVVHELCVIAQNPEEFFAGMQGSVFLKDCVDDFYASTTLLLPPPKETP
jgi:hypothetical protein